MIQNWQEFLQQKSAIHPLITNLSHFGLLKISGPDATSFLQGQLSCDIQDITKGTSSLGAYCNIKGRVECLFRIFLLDECYYLRFPLGLVEQTLNELQKYAAFSKVEVTDASNEIIKIGVAGKDIESFLLNPDSQTIVIRVPSPRSQSRFEVYTCANHSNNPDPLVNTLEQNIQYVSNNLWELLEINAQLPEIYPETVGKFLPHYINLPQLQAVSFNKGCFRGQEIIARMEYKGTIKRHLQHISCTNSQTLPSPGEDLLNSSSSIIGKIIRSSLDANQHIQALAEIADHAVDEPIILASNNSCVFHKT
jgi:tRNA-modifying protein YgfZ